MESKEKKFSKTLVLIGILLGIIFLMFIVLEIVDNPYNKADNTYVDVTIANGSSTDDVASKLKENGIIGSEGKFKFISCVKFYNDKYKPGIYSLSPSMSLTTISNTIINGIKTDKGFVLPPGYTIKQTAEALEVAGFCKMDKFLEVASSRIFDDLGLLESVPEGDNQLEGYLMPGEYEMSEDADEVQIIVTMLNQFNNEYTQEYKVRTAELGKSVNDILVIASIIEKATSKKGEKADISQVIYNRLNAGLQPLEGMPDRPLCSPSIESIKAALYPSEGDYMFYVKNAKLNGTNKFTADENEYIHFKEEYDAAIAAKKTKAKKGNQ